MEAALRHRIKELQKYRKAGLRWLRSAKLYDKMVATQPAGQPHLLNDVIDYIQVCACLLCVYFLLLFGTGLIDRIQCHGINNQYVIMCTHSCPCFLFNWSVFHSRHIWKPMVIAAVGFFT